MCRVIVVGFGIQGKKRKMIAGNECVAIVDPYFSDADFKHVYDVPLSLYDAAIVSTPDCAKAEILTYLLEAKKHVLVEKPLLVAPLAKLKALSEKNQVTCYTAYNHRFEPHFVEARKILKNNDLGKLYQMRLFYGNGTARDVRNSPWRDQGSGVLVDLGSHLLDTLFFWLDKEDFAFKTLACHCFENKSPDHMLLYSEKPFPIELEISLLSWRNHFTCDLIGSEGSLHIESLCKWGPSKLTLRKRMLPSGRPEERSTTLVQPDPTWAEEYRHFKELCKQGLHNLEGDLQIASVLHPLMEEVCV